MCSRMDARRGLCPPGSRVGSSRARTPLLDQPLVGSIYVVRPRGNGLSRLMSRLGGGAGVACMKKELADAIKELEEKS